MGIFKMIISFIAALFIILLAISIILVINTAIIEIKKISAQKEFCKDNGFTGINNENECINKDKISSHKVECELTQGWKVECFWDKRERVDVK